MTIDQILEETAQEIRTAASAMAVPELQLKTRRQVAPRPRRLVTAGASAFLVMLAVLLVTLIPLGDDSSFVDQALDLGATQFRQAVIQKTIKALRHVLSSDLKKAARRHAATRLNSRFYPPA